MNRGSKLYLRCRLAKCGMLALGEPAEFTFVIRDLYRDVRFEREEALGNKLFHDRSLVDPLFVVCLE